MASVRVAAKVASATGPILRRVSASVPAACPRLAAGLSCSSQHRTFASGPRHGNSGSQGSDKFYRLLDVDKGAGEAEIKQAYKKQAMKHHPDRGGDENTFKEISRAYEVLSDAEKRQIYDQYGEAGLEGAQHSPGGGAGPGMDPFDLFSHIFGFNPKRSQRGRPITADSTYELQLSLEDLYAGTTRSIKFNRECLCGKCKGEGGKDKQVCQRCNGTGVTVKLVQNAFFVQQVQSPCAACAGKGSTIKAENICLDCKGKGTQKEQKTFSIDIEPGLSDNAEFRFQGQADQAPGHDSGDVIIVVREKPHRTFKRMKDDLLITKKITLAEALCGFEFSAAFLDGEQLVIRSRPGEVLRPGQLMRIKGKGMPRKHGQKPGDLFLKLEVEFPAEVPPEGRAKLAELLGGSALPEECSSKAAVAEKVSNTEAAGLHHRWAQAAHEREGGGGGQEASCTQQ